MGFRYSPSIAIIPLISTMPSVMLSPRLRASATRTEDTWASTSLVSATGVSSDMVISSISPAINTVSAMPPARSDTMPWQKFSILGPSAPPFREGMGVGCPCVSARGRKVMPPTPPVRSSIGFRAAGRCVPPPKLISFPLNSQL